ncbi:MAG: VCBS repeat-containing protein, partial [Anaerolineales bacterium]|nr:VCBS repeat-containing protein [Anaerolineales bacterium]
MPRQLFPTLRILSIGRWRPITVSLLLSAFCLIGMTVVLNAQTNPNPHQLSNIKQNTFSLEQLTTTANDEFTLYWISPDAKNTSRIAWGDADGDGDLDLAVGNREQINQLYLNDGAKNFSPSDLGPEVRASTSIAWGDADGDGDLDLAVGNINTYDLDCFCYLTDGINQLYINDGSGHFTAFDLGTESRHTESIAWGDADGDGDLDLAVGNYEGYPCYCGVSQLLINDGSGHFNARDLDPAAKPTTTIAWGDADNDGDLDLAVGNENEINQLYYNDGTGHFTPVDLGTEVQQTTALAWGDVDNDGDLDLAVGNLATWVTSDYENGETQLYLNDGLGNLMVVSDTLGIASSRTTSIMWGDADNDGDLDLAVGNTSQTDQLYLNNGTGSFTSTLNI